MKFPKLFGRSEVKQSQTGEARKAVLLAAVRRLHYNASIAQGFSPDEALTLCMDSVRME
jgi:hypothetical protein